MAGYKCNGKRARHEDGVGVFIGVLGCISTWWSGQDSERRQTLSKKWWLSRASVLLMGEQLEQGPEEHYIAHESGLE